MPEHSPERRLELGERVSRLRGSVLHGAPLVAAFLFGRAAGHAVAGKAAPSKTEQKLMLHVRDFDNQNAALIPTLLQVAALYSLPMGVEKVGSKAMSKPISVRMRSGNVADVLTLAVRQLPGYAWAVEDGAVDIFGNKERSDPSNLFNFVLPSFEVHDQTLDAASLELRTTLVLEVLKPPGVGGSYLGSAELEKRRISFSLRQPSVRHVLNHMVALDGGAVWLARVRPNCLQHLPEAGFWMVLPHSDRDPLNLVDLSPCRSR